MSENPEPDRCPVHSHISNASRNITPISTRSFTRSKQPIDWSFSKPRVHGVRDYYPLAETSLSVNEDEWNSRAEAGHFPPCGQLDYLEEPQEPSTDVHEVAAHTTHASKISVVAFKLATSPPSPPAILSTTTPNQVRLRKQRPRKLLAHRKMRSYCSYGWTGQQPGSGLLDLTPAALGVFASSDRF
jgi:hypothetical protein